MKHWLEEREFCTLQENSLVYQPALTNHAQSIESDLGTVSQQQLILGEEKFITRKPFFLQYLATKRVIVQRDKNGEAALQPTWFGIKIFFFFGV